MISGLEAANRYLNKKRAVYIYFPGGGERGLIRIPKIEKQPERPLLQEIKGCVIEKWGVLDLLDILIEADRQVDLLQSFQTSGQRQVISPQEARERLVLSLFSLGTNTELKRIHAAATPKCSYDDLLYFRKRFVRIPAVRAAITALTNRILDKEFRDYAPEDAKKVKLIWKYLQKGFRYRVAYEKALAELQAKYNKS